VTEQRRKRGPARQIRLAVQDRACRVCGGKTYAQDRKRRTVSTRDGRLAIESQMTLCCDEACPGRHRLVVAEEEALIAPPWWRIGWDVFAWIGHRRFSLHRSVPDIREELDEEFGIELSDDAIEDYVAKYQAILAARQNDPGRLAEEYRGIKDLVLTIDGLQPEKGHETLYTVRELNAGRIWFAVPLLSSAAEEVRVGLLEKAKEWVSLLGKPVRAWMSDKQDAFVTGIAVVFPDVPHRYCQSHFLRDVAKPMAEFDSHVKVQMRVKVRGLREIERKALADQKQAETPQAKAASEVVLKYCGTVRGILNRNQGGPLDPPGLRMARTLEEVRASLDRSLAGGLAGPAKSGLTRLAGCIDRGMAVVTDDLKRIPGYVADMRAIQATIDPKQGSIRTRQQRFDRLVAQLAADRDEIRRQMAGTMERFRPGLFAGGAKLDLLKDNMDLERWFRLPKSHARKIHGRQHAGTRIVVEGPSLALALDAHRGHRKPFTEDELRPYFGARPDPNQHEAAARRRLMAKARSREGLPELLADLEAQSQGLRAP
jgi:hypothetical protein